MRIDGQGLFTLVIGAIFVLSGVRAVIMRRAPLTRAGSLSFRRPPPLEGRRAVYAGIFSVILGIALIAWGVVRSGTT